jgi:hypothetical protein
MWSRLRSCRSPRTAPGHSTSPSGTTWEVVGPDGQVLATRVLLHPHENEQPFTRSLDGVVIPPGVNVVTVRAHDKLHGYGGTEVMISIPR